MWIISQPIIYFDQMNAANNPITAMGFSAMFAFPLDNTKGGGMYLIFPVIVIVIVTVIVLLQSLACTFGQN